MKLKFLYTVLFTLLFATGFAQQKNTKKSELNQNTLDSKINYTEIDTILENLQKKRAKRNLRRQKQTVFRVVDTVFVEMKLQKADTKLTDF
ncbi:hypothetical protein [Aquimarina brevivitae]|uniref:Uncharacterized protein n=1 Tax=Aquimarina brevivitae TaxID=323412 RepID=A0A4V2F5B6_9FLAO|nr:hypothetical protein [Aquimarina brevivitae]RZS92249.1 hypothetical protein EV197_2885 [Aquimarina brevivitae]